MSIKPGRGILPLIFAIPFLSVSWTTVIQSSTPEIVDEFGKGEFARSSIIWVGSASGILLAPFIGMLADRFGRRIVIVSSLTVFGLSGALGAWSPSFEILIASRALIGIGSSGLIGLAVASIADFFFGEERIRYVGFNTACGAAGLAVHPFIGGLVADAFGWRYAIAITMFAFPLAVAIWFLLPEAELPKATPLRQQLRLSADLLKSYRVYIVLAWFFVMFFFIFGVAVVAIPAYLQDEFGLSEAQRGLVFAFGASGSGLVALLIGRIRRFLIPKNVFRTSAFLFGAAVFVMGNANLALLVAVGLFVQSVAEGASLTTGQEVLASTAGVGQRATLLMLGMVASRAGQFIGSAVFGFMGDRYSYEAQFTLAAFVLLGFGMLSYLPLKVIGQGRALPTGA